MRMAVDLKFEAHGRRGWLVVIGWAGRKNCARQRGQQQRGGTGLYHRAAGDLDCTGSIWLPIGFVLVHDMLHVCEARKRRYGKASGLRPTPSRSSETSGLRPGVVGKIDDNGRCGASHEPTGTAPGSKD